ncbi:MAG: hypothetical protein U5K54_12270 [Cytophagales bacterium]|nr:hypothetical protein [Cytophagales bacterium]
MKKLGSRQILGRHGMHFYSHSDGAGYDDQFPIHDSLDNQYPIRTVSVNSRQLTMLGARLVAFERTSVVTASTQASIHPTSVPG